MKNLHTNSSQATNSKSDIPEKKNSKVSELIKMDLLEEAKNGLNYAKTSI